MPIYKYTLKKYLKSYSTWIIFLVTSFLIILISGVVPFKLVTTKSGSDYSKMIIFLIPGMIVFLSIFSSVFAGFKSANMFKDEVEDGTFLIMLSKPISRMKILGYKWLALQTIILGYVFASSGVFVATLTLFDNHSSFPNLEIKLGIKSMKFHAPMILGFTTMILYIMSLTFSSIGILLSTRFSVSTSLGIAIALGSVIPITSLIKTFTQKKEVSIVLNKPLFWKATKLFDKVSNKNMQSFLEEQTDGKSKEFLKKINFEKRFNDHKSKLKELQKDPESIYELGIHTGEKDSYKNLWFFDTNTQIKKLASFVYDEIIPESVRESPTFEKATNSFYEATEKDIFNSSGSFIDSRKKFDLFIKKSWNKTKEIRADTIRIWAGLVRILANDLQSSYDKITSGQEAKKTRNIYFRQLLDKAFLLFMPKPQAVEKPLTGFNIKGKNIDTFVNKILETADIVSKSDKNTTEEQYKQVIYLAQFLHLFTWNELDGIITYSNPNSTIVSLFKNMNRDTHMYLIPVDAPNIPNLEVLIKLKDLGNWEADEYTQNSLVKIAFKNQDFSTVYTQMILNQFAESNNKTSLDFHKDFYVRWYSQYSLFLSKKIPFSRVKMDEYASKYTVLAIFLGISLSLVPLTYIVIRRKDFR